jgi:drug/metabolite transporter (DMT)-like permease
VFVLVWSSGYIAGSLGTREADPGALGFWRFLVATGVLGAVVLVRRRRWPRQWAHLLVIGVLLQNVQYTGAFVAIDLGMPAGLAALIADASPIVVAVGAAVLFGEKIRPLQLVGVIVGIAGVGLVVSADLALRFGFVALLAALVGLTGSSGGTLYQKGVDVETDLLTSTFVQLVGATISMVPVALLRGGFAMPITVTTVGSVLWLAVVGSIVSFVLLFMLLRAQPGAKATSYLFLVPPTTAVLGTLLLNEPLTGTALVGFGVAAVGVGLVAIPKTRSAKYASEPASVPQPGQQN